MQKLLLLAFAILSLTSCSKSKNSILSVDISGFSSDSIILTVIDRNFEGEDTVINIAAKKGKFSQELSYGEPRLVFIGCKGDSGRKYENGYISFFVMPGENVDLKGTVDDYEISGSRFNEDYNSVNKKILSIQNRMKDLSKEGLSAYNSSENKDSVEALYNKKIYGLIDEQDKYIKDYISSNLSNPVSAALLVSIEEGLDEYLSKLSESVKAGPMASIVTVLEKRAEQIKSAEEARNRILPGNPAPDFTLADIEGKPFSLSSLRGKYVVLDFWGSWCVWCIKGIPDMKAAYAKYKGKVEFVSIDCNDSEEAWKKAVKEQGMPWPQVYNAPENDVTGLYSIQGFPTKIILDQEGKILKTVEGEDPQFYKDLEDILK